MSKKRRQFSAEQKTKIVLEVLQSDSTLNQIASKYEISPNVIQNWKKQFLENASIAMEPSKVVKEYKAEIDEKDKKIEALHKALGKATIELEFVQKSSSAWAHQIRALWSLSWKTLISQGSVTF